MIIFIIILLFVVTYICAPTESIKNYKTKSSYQIRKEIAIIVSSNTNMELLNEAIKYFDIDFRVIDWNENILSNIYHSGYRVIVIDVEDDNILPIDLSDDMIIINSRGNKLNCYNIEKHWNNQYNLWDSIILGYECLKYIDGKFNKNHIINLATRYTFGYTGRIEFNDEGNRHS